MVVVRPSDIEGEGAKAVMHSSRRSSEIKRLINIIGRNLTATKWASIYAWIVQGLKHFGETHLTYVFSTTWSWYGGFLPSLITNITACSEVAEKTFSVSMSVASTNGIAK